MQLTANVSGIASSSADRPNCVSDPNISAPHTVAEWFNVGSFAPNTTIVPTTGSPYKLLGSCGRNIVAGPAVRNYDTTLAKTFPITEHTHLEFRTDFFDIFNHPNFNTPNRYFGTATFGQITSAQTPRLIQFRFCVLHFSRTRYVPSRRQLLGGLSLGGLMLTGLTALGGAAPLGRFSALGPPSTPDDSSTFPVPPISTAAHSSRIGRIRDKMRAAGIDCLLVSSVLNHAVRYLGFFDPELQGRGSGTPQLVSVLLPLEGDPVPILAIFHRR